MSKETDLEIGRVFDGLDAALDALERLGPADLPPDKLRDLSNYLLMLEANVTRLTWRQGE